MIWRRFVLRRQRAAKLGDPTGVEAESFYAEARQIVDETLRAVRSKKFDTIQKQAAEAVKRIEDRPPTPAVLLARLLLRSPQAARAQSEMDKHTGGYSNRQARVYELIDFNDVFVDLVLSLHHEDRVTFPQRLWNELDIFARTHHSPRISEQQFEAITHGLSREIAVYLGAKDQGFKARMTSRVQDARGIDMIITDPATNRSIEVDCKTHSSFHFRLLGLERKHRMSEKERIDCEAVGYCQIRGSKKEDPTNAILLRISTEELGAIEHFRFVDTDKLGERLHQAIHDFGIVIVEG